MEAASGWRVRLAPENGRRIRGRGLLRDDSSDMEGVGGSRRVQIWME